MLQKPGREVRLGESRSPAVMIGLRVKDDGRFDALGLKDGISLDGKGRENDVVFQTVEETESSSATPILKPLGIDAAADRLHCREKVRVTHSQVENTEGSHRNTTAIDVFRIYKTQRDKGVQQSLDSVQGYGNRGIFREHPF